MRQVAGVCIAVVLFMLLGGFDSRIRTVDSMPIHEGFVTPVRDIPPLQAVPAQPPAPINEVIPPQTDSSMIWIPGYWAYSDELSNFVWVTGVWRRPPPDHQWIPGRWQEFENGWVWIAGLWSDKSESQLSFVENRPPDALDDEVASPSDGANATWAQGYWSWIADNSQFEWVQGTWMNYDPNWVFVPAHWTWRPEGYVFVDSYWDWPLDMRGSAYSPVYIAPSDLATVAYEPSSILDSSYVFDTLLPYYPDYSYLYSNDFCRRPQFWQDSDLCPPWWGWGNWWGGSWSNQWGLWWWWSHPGYVQPGFVSDTLGSFFVPPSKRLVQKCAGIQRPTIVTQNGVVSSSTALRAGRDAWGSGAGRRNPIFPANFASSKNQEQLGAKLPQNKRNVIFPTGKKREHRTSTQGPSPQFSDLPRQGNMRQRPQNEPVKPRPGRQQPQKAPSAPKAPVRQPPSQKAPSAPKAPVRQPPSQKAPKGAPSAQTPRQVPKAPVRQPSSQKVPKKPSSQPSRQVPKAPPVRQPSSQRVPTPPSRQVPRQPSSQRVPSQPSRQVPRQPSSQRVPSQPSRQMPRQPSSQRVPTPPSRQVPRQPSSQRAPSAPMRSQSSHSQQQAPRQQSMQRAPSAQSQGQASRGPVRRSSSEGQAPDLDNSVTEEE